MFNYYIHEIDDISFLNNRRDMSVVKTVVYTYSKGVWFVKRLKDTCG